MCSKPPLGGGLGTLCAAKQMSVTHYLSINGCPITNRKGTDLEKSQDFQTVRNLAQRNPLMDCPVVSSCHKVLSILRASTTQTSVNFLNFAEL